jgi:phospholipase C
MMISEMAENVQFQGCSVFLCPGGSMSLRNIYSVVNVSRFLLVVAIVAVGMPRANAQATCALNTASPSVTICTPANNATGLTSPVHVNAGATDTGHTIKLMQIFIDGVGVTHVANQPWIDANVPMAAGTHRLTVQATDETNLIFKTPIMVTVGGTPPPPPGNLSNLKHIFFMAQENRSFDSYLGRLGQYRVNHNLSSNVNGFPSVPNYASKTTSGALVHPFPYQTVCTEQMTPAWNESHSDVDGGAMDRFPITNSKSIPSTIDPQGTRAMGYYDWNLMPYYYDLAFNFGTSDNFFSGVQSNTIPNRMYLFTGTSFGHIRSDAPPTGTRWSQPTIFDKLDAANPAVTWRYYYQDNSIFLAQFSTWNRDSGKVRNIGHPANSTGPATGYYLDIQNSSTFPSVIFIERASQTGLDEHPTKNVQKGSAAVKQIIDALMASQSWGSSAFILTFDEGGGAFDHVPPIALPKPDGIPPMLKSTDIVADFDHSGFRIPLWVVSPWSKPNYVSHTGGDFTSILKLIEVRFGLTSLTSRDGAASDMTEFFDFSAPHFATPPALPAQPTTGVCDKTKEKAPNF